MNVFQERKTKLKSFRNDIKELNLIKEELPIKQIEIPDDVFHFCGKCQTNTLTEEFNQNLYVCPSCGYHEKVKTKHRIKQICDSFTEINGDMKTINISFLGYQEKLEKYCFATKLNEAVTTGIGMINDVKIALAIMDSNFMMGSMGSVVGEKITILIEEAIKEKLPLIIFCASGGARMQEGIISLMQMAKISGALGRYKEKGLYISVLTHPTTGGVSASFASLGDITIAEPKSLIGFAGKRVIENTIKESLPDEFQSAEFLLEKGFIDLIVERKELKDTLYKILKIHKF